MESLVEQRCLLTPDEAAAMLAVAPGTLMVWRSTGRFNLPYLKIGGAVRYRRDAVEQFMAARTVDPTADPNAKLRATLDLRSHERRSHKARRTKKRAAR